MPRWNSPKIHRQSTRKTKFWPPGNEPRIYQMTLTRDGAKAVQEALQASIDESIATHRDKMDFRAEDDTGALWVWNRAMGEAARIGDKMHLDVDAYGYDADVIARNLSTQLGKSSNPQALETVIETIRKGRHSKNNLWQPKE